MNYNRISMVDNDAMDPMFIEEPDSMITRPTMKEQLHNKVILPMKYNVVDPFNDIISLMDRKSNNVFNFQLWRRFIYFLLVVFVLIFISQYDRIRHYKPIDHDLIREEVRDWIDLNKFEKNWEYLSNLPHCSGTKGDETVSQYVMDSFLKSGMKNVKLEEYKGYLNYPSNETHSLIVFKNNGTDEILKFELGENNFNPLSWNGKVENSFLIYGGDGTKESLQRILENNNNDILDHRDNFVLLLHYDGLVSEQLILAQMLGARGVLFISDKFDQREDVILMKSVAIPQFYTGDLLSPGWEGNSVRTISLNESDAIPHIPTLPLSYNQGQQLLSLVKSEGKNGIRVSFEVKTIVERRHPVYNVIGKIEGREQPEKAIILSSSRNSIHHGAVYPNFGTTMLLQFVELFQIIKKKYNWKPLRSIYFVSFGGNEYNHIGSTEFYEKYSLPLQQELYSIVDITELGINVMHYANSSLKIETHPLLKNLFEDTTMDPNMNVSVSHVQHYGDWIPFLANGIPVSVISDPDLNLHKYPIHTKESTFANIEETLKDNNSTEAIQIFEITIYILDKILRLVDVPNIPYGLTDYVEVVDELLHSLEKDHSKKLNFDKMIRALLRWKKIGTERQKWLNKWQSHISSSKSKKKNHKHNDIESVSARRERCDWNNRLTDIAKKTCSEYGLTGRPFYKALLFGPTFLRQRSDQDSWSFPAVKDSIMNLAWTSAQKELDDVARLLQLSAKPFLRNNAN
ncbi:putative zinc metalloprotease NDAI_0E01050 [Naumovozyma dairenensis CBS 421]|uniref:Uncharacterized protein n=1 Tax=Naumovozyma dairenensis (strain ATCC 10597 / BCRC 20456 / CBS 421 / NBRC 0211 / NRRL Y-12639) TaxID=1071378 RepID=G0WB01_NAUDC|nr:hypothetical protein NDAI_0E01050 [Naumovozyma dairenensis CBS 421]CCD24921.1 hypothetical protein NDAI_0E01050 [Naumovozyma dairenensis CBS 421]